MRKLASIQKVVATVPIEGADAIEVVFVLGWQVVAKKGVFKSTTRDFSFKAISNSYLLKQK